MIEFVVHELEGIEAEVNHMAGALGIPSGDLQVEIVIRDPQLGCLVRRPLSLVDTEQLLASLRSELEARNG